MRYKGALMSRRRAWPRPLVVSLIASALAVALAPGAAADTPAPETTSPLEAARVDSVPAQVLDWRPCGKTECARARVPLDYDEPQGAADRAGAGAAEGGDSKRRIGSLFINPGGPGLSGVGYAKFGPKYFKPELLERFDLIGIDPRGTNASAPLRCFPSLSKAGKDLAGLLATRSPPTRPKRRPPSAPPGLPLKLARSSGSPAPCRPRSSPATWT